MIKTSTTYKSHWHCVYQLKYHLVLVTKYRHKCFTKDILERLEEEWDYLQSVRLANLIVT